MNQETLTALEHLNQLALTPEQEAAFLAFYDARVADQAQLDAIDTAATERQVWVQPMENVLREDIPSQPFSRDALLEQAPETQDGYWQVPRVLV